MIVPTELSGSLPRTPRMAPCTTQLTAKKKAQYLNKKKRMKKKEDKKEKEKEKEETLLEFNFRITKNYLVENLAYVDEILKTGAPPLNMYFPHCVRHKNSEQMELNIQHALAWHKDTQPLMGAVCKHMEYNNICVHRTAQDTLTLFYDKSSLQEEYLDLIRLHISRALSCISRALPVHKAQPAQTVPVYEEPMPEKKEEMPENPEEKPEEKATPKKVVSQDTAWKDFLKYADNKAAENQALAEEHADLAERYRWEAQNFQARARTVQNRKTGERPTTVSVSTARIEALTAEIHNLHQKAAETETLLRQTMQAVKRKQIKHLLSELADTRRHAHLKRCVTILVFNKTKDSNV